MDALTIHRLHFAFTVTFHYIFPAADHGPGAAAGRAEDHGAANRQTSITISAARFWARIFAINFAMGVVTGIPMEFQFGTNWARFSKAAGGVIGQTLAMEGVFSFFLESSFPGPVSVRREAARTEGALARGLLWFSWARGFPDSSSSRPTPGCSIRWATRSGPHGRNPAVELLGTAAESVAALAVPAQHDRRGGHRQLRDGGRGRVLPAGRNASRAYGQTVRADRRDRGHRRDRC